MLTSRATRPVCATCAKQLQQQHGQQVRHATLLRRPKRPYTFTQLLTLSDGSTFLHRTTSPTPIYRTTKDTKNNALWNPSSQKLLNIEEDEAGRLKRFRRRFGRGYDAESMSEGEETGDAEDTRLSEDSLMDLISGFGKEAEGKAEAAGNAEAGKKSGKSKEGKK